MKIVRTHFIRIVVTMAIVVAAAIVALTPDTPIDFFSTQARTPASSARLPYIPLFKDHTADSGLFMEHVQGEEKLSGLDESIGSGACAFDYDNDGWVDLFMIGGSGQTHHFGQQQWWQTPKGNHLFRNTGHARFRDVTKTSGLTPSGAAGMGCAHADLDNDGDQDLLVTTTGENMLFRNNGDGTFSDVSKESGLTGKAWSTSAAIADYDGDGLPDIYIVNYLDFNKAARLKETDAGFVAFPPPLFRADLFDGIGNQLFRNLGGMKFTELAMQAGVDDQGGRGLSAMWQDINHDRKIDLVVANDVGTPSRLFINQGNGHFASEGERYGMNSTLGFHSLAAGDMNGDGATDMVVGTPNGQLPKILMHSSSGDDRFEEEARTLGLTATLHASFSTWGMGVRDFNLDGTLDLFTVNGLPFPDMDAPRIPTGQSNKIWLNTGPGLYDASNETGLALTEPVSGRGAAFADFDNDGDVDVLLMNNNNPVKLLLNETNGMHWLGIHLIGKHSRDATGSQIILSGPNGKQYRELTDSSGFMSGNDSRIHFGLGHVSKPVSLTIVWPDGSRQTYSDIKPDRYVTIRQGNITAEDLAITPVEVEPSKGYLLKIGNDISALRAKYLGWLVESDDGDSTLGELDVAMGDTAPSVRRVAIEQLEKLSSTPATLKILSKGLRDPYADVRIAAIRVLGKFENESTIYWLLDALHDPDASVRIASIQAFEHFFYKEEAMVYRKWLAVPILIKLLQDSSDAVKAAAARALGESAAYRSLSPLISLLQARNTEVRIQAIRSLGLLRERTAESALESIAADSRENVRIRANALIALARIDPAVYQLLYRRVVQTPNSGDNIALLNALLGEEDNDVLDRKHIIADLITRLANQSISSSHEHKIEGLKAMALLGHQSTKGAQSLVLRLASSNDLDIRILALRTLLTFDKINRRGTDMFTRALSDPAAEIRGIAMEAALKLGIKVETKWLRKQLKHAETIDIATVMLEKQAPKKTESMLLDILKNKDISIAARTKAAGLLGSHPSRTVRSSLKDLFLDASEPRDLRVQALKTFASITPNSLELIRLMHLRHHMLSNQALGLLAQTHNSDALSELREILASTSTPASDRIFAAETLHKIHPHQTLAFLRGGSYE